MRFELLGLTPGDSRHQAHKTSCFYPQAGDHEWAPGWHPGMAAEAFALPSFSTGGKGRDSSLWPYIFNPPKPHVLSTLRQRTRIRLLMFSHPLSIPAVSGVSPLSSSKK